MGSDPAYWTPEGIAALLSNPQVFQHVSNVLGQAMNSQLPLQDLLQPQGQTGQSQTPQQSPTATAIQAQGSAEPVAQANPLANWETGAASLQQQGNTAQSALTTTPVTSPFWQSYLDHLKATTAATQDWRSRNPRSSSNGSSSSNN